MLPQTLDPSDQGAVDASASRRRSVPRVRAMAILVHRWVGLAMAAFLIVAGSTGTVLAFYHDLDARLNPELYEVTPPSPNAPVLDAIELRERVQRSFPKEPIASAVLDVEPGRPVNYWIEAPR